MQDYSMKGRGGGIDARLVVGIVGGEPIPMWMQSFARGISVVILLMTPIFWVLSLFTHLASVYVAYQFVGLGAALLSLCLPFLAEIFWFIYIGLKIGWLSHWFTICIISWMSFAIIGQLLLNWATRNLQKVSDGTVYVGPEDKERLDAHRKREAEGFKSLKARAENGRPDDQCAVGLSYAYGRGVEQDFMEAVKWYRKAAEQGVALAQHELGLMYANGRGVEKDDKEAVKWCRKAAEQGDDEAKATLKKRWDL